MQTLRTKALIFFFWLPTAISVLLNPGGGYRGVSAFSLFELILLFLCGIVLIAGCLLHVLKPAVLSHWYEAKTNYSAYFLYLLFSGFFGFFDVYSAANQLLHDKF